MTDIPILRPEVVPVARDEPTYVAHDVAGAFADHHARLLRIAYLLTGDHGTAEDVVADAFVKAYPHLARGRVDDPGAYLRQAVVNGVRRRGARRTLERRERDRHLRVVWTSSFEDDSLVRDELLAALDRLSARQRAVVVLRFYDDRSEAETAALLGISPGSVKTHSHRALAQLRTILQEDPS